MKESQPPDMRSRAPRFAGKLLLNKNGSAAHAMLEQLFEMRIRLAPPGQPPDMRSRAPQFAGKLLLNKNGPAEAEP